jgi:urocanate hydratase
LSSRKGAERLERVLSTDSEIGVARHVDAGYKEALSTAKKGVKIPTLITLVFIISPDIL